MHSTTPQENGMRVNVFTVVIVLILASCQWVKNDNNQPETKNTNLLLKSIIFDIQDSADGSIISIKLDYPKDWKTEMISSNVFYASENPEFVTDGFRNNFHVAIYNDVANTDIQTYSSNFHITEQKDFPELNFQMLKSEIIEDSNGIIFQVDQTKIWGNLQDTLFSISALTKMDRKVIHLNFYSNYKEKEVSETLAKNIVRNIRIVE